MTGANNSHSNNNNDKFLKLLNLYIWVFNFYFMRTHTHTHIKLSKFIFVNGFSGQIVYDIMLYHRYVLLIGSNEINVLCLIYECENNELASN